MSNLSDWRSHLAEYRKEHPGETYKQAQKNAKGSYQKVPPPPPRNGAPPLLKSMIPRRIRKKAPPKLYKIDVSKPFKIKAPKLVKIAKGDPEVNRLKKKIRDARAKLAGAGYSMKIR